jgi:hypothetical protein
LREADGRDSLRTKGGDWLPVIQSGG